MSTSPLQFSASDSRDIGATRDTQENPFTRLADCTASQLLALYRSGQASPVEALHDIEARIAQDNPKINAFCWLDSQTSGHSAMKSEAAWLQHRRTGAPVGELEGVPVSIKDLILTQGWPTRRGSKTVNLDQPWDTDAPAVARLREAGAVLIGKTTTPEFGCKAETNSPATGLTRNPWDLRKTPGGSSGGAAAAVAAGMGPLAMGTDGAGSVRIPASFCGNFGLKPSFGRVPAYPLSPFGSVAHLGTHSLSVADTALAMNVLKRPDARDWTALPPDASDYTVGLNDGVRGLRIAYSPTLGYAKHVHPDVARAVAAAADDFVALGAQVEQVDPGFDDPMDITAGLWFLGAWAVWNGLNPAQQAVTDPDFAAQAEFGARFSALDIQQLHQRRGVLGGHMRQFMQRYDLLITPTVTIPAFDALPAGHRAMDPETFLGWTPFSYPFNLTQQPACTIPCGFSGGGPGLPGLPLGLQIVGPMFGDALVLRAARAYEALRPIPRLRVVE